MRRFEPPVERSGYKLDGRLQSLIQHRVDEHRRVLATRAVVGSYRFWPESGRVSWYELRDESLGDEGWED